MNDPVLLRVDGAVTTPLLLTFADLSAIDAAQQIEDVSKIAEGRKGDAVKLAAVLELAGVGDDARFLGLHSSTDDFHASIPLEPVREKGILIYRLEGDPLSLKAGGPVRFFIQDYAACHTDDIDECANVKFVDHIEFTKEKGFDNRPEDDEEHEKLHANEH